MHEIKYLRQQTPSSPIDTSPKRGLDKITLMNITIFFIYLFSQMALSLGELSKD
jgi:hypothetical protein